MADEKSDLYSVGVVLYEMLTGQVPFDGDTAVSVALKHVSEEPRSMRDRAPNISRALDEVVMRALAKDSARRYQTAAEFAGDLRKAVVRPRGGFVTIRSRVRSRSASARNSAARPCAASDGCKRVSFFAAIFVGVAVIGSLVWYFSAVYNMESVPLTIGSEEAAATTVITQRGFTPVVEYAYSEEYPQGLVMQQTVEAGQKRRRGTEIGITVSAGSQWIYFEDMTGWTLEQVYAELTGLGVAAERVSVTYAVSDKPVGCVAGQSPEPGWITRETDIVLILSAETVEVPPLTGLTFEGAQAQAEAGGPDPRRARARLFGGRARRHGHRPVHPPGEVVAEGTELILTISQPRQMLYYPPSNYTLYVPLSNVEVVLEIVPPSGAASPASAARWTRAPIPSSFPASSRGCTPCASTWTACSWWKRRSCSSRRRSVAGHHHPRRWRALLRPRRAGQTHHCDAQAKLTPRALKA